MSLMGVDIGSSGCKVSVYTSGGDFITSAEASYDVLRGEAGRFELDCFEVERALYKTIKAAADTCQWENKFQSDPVEAISVGSFGEAMVPLDKEGNILGPSIFSHDQRRKDSIARFEALGAEAFYRINGNILGYSYTYPKLVWYQEDQPEMHNKIWKVLSWADFLVYRLSGVAATNYCHANRTLLFDLWKEQWSQELLEAGGLDGRILADTIPPGTVTGTILPEMARTLNLKRDVKIIVGGHDQCINALGAGAVKGGDSVTGIGTVECTTVIFDSIPDAQTMLQLNLGVEHHVVPGKYVAFIHNQAGALQTWFMKAFTSDLQRQGMSESAILTLLTDEAPPSPSNLLFFPFVEPSGAPLFLPAGNGLFLGMEATTGRGELYRALLEGETMFFLEAFEKLEAHGILITDILATGGGSRSDLWLQIKADMLHRPVRRARYRESGTAGAAIAAGLAIGIYKSVEEGVAAFKGTEKDFVPNQAHAEIYKRLQMRYREIVEKILL
ncbi:MAG: FGGY-family carbohydrate kinase [Sphaerochaetaceae bacterium]